MRFNKTVIISLIVLIECKCRVITNKYSVIDPDHSTTKTPGPHRLSIRGGLSSSYLVQQCENRPVCTLVHQNAC